MSRAKLPIRFPDWVPEPARRRIGELRETPWGIDDFGRDLLERLATRQAMKDEVWGKLPPEPKFIQEKIIDWVFFAVSIFPRLGRPYPKTMPKWREWAKQAQKYPRLPSPETVSGYALLLREGIYELKTETDIHWHRLWGGVTSRSPRIRSSPSWISFTCFTCGWMRKIGPSSPLFPRSSDGMLRRRKSSLPIFYRVA
jgi:hypothetical protein